MDKSIEYRLINALTKCGEVSDASKHRIGRVGKFLRLTKGMRFEFVFDYETNNHIRSSKVEEIEELDDLIKVHTLNTIYIFKEV